jgi:16S rRNA (guanine966-N2)-methyltransferase
MRRCEVRIIGGVWRSRRLRFEDRPELRPTPDRVRETLFNWLGQDLTGRDCLDLYAGSGALGFEAASRGARRVVMVERDAQSLRTLRVNAAMLGAGAVEVVRADAIEFLRQHQGRYDFVFLDPPFADDSWPQLFVLLPRCLKPGALVYCERAAALGAVPGWTVIKSGRAGQVSHQLLEHSEPRAEHEQ